MNWFCVHTKPQKETHALWHCEKRLGLETYFPRIRQQKRIRRVKRIVTSPLFPRYLFCRFDLGSHYRAVRYGAEVIDVVSFGGRPTPVDDEIVAQMKTWAGEALDITAVKPPLAVGDLVEITEGPMQGLQAVFLHEMSDRDRVAVLLSTLNCQARLIINRSRLERVVTHESGLRVSASL